MTNTLDKKHESLEDPNRKRVEEILAEIVQNTAQVMQTNQKTWEGEIRPHTKGGKEWVKRCFEYAVERGDLTQEEVDAVLQMPYKEVLLRYFDQVRNVYLEANNQIVLNQIKEVAKLLLERQTLLGLMSE